MGFPDKTLIDLEWSGLLSHLSNRCSGEEAAAACRELPFLEPQEIPDRLALIDEFIRNIGEGDAPPTLPLTPLGPWLPLIQGEGSVPPEALLSVASNLRLFLEIHRYLENRRDTCPLNASIVAPDQGGVSSIGLARLAAEIESSFDPDGSISDGASSELRSLRRRVVSLRGRLVDTVEKIANQESDLLQERNVTLRNDRFVLPVRVDAHRKFKGIVHGASSSGATVFVEPESVIEAGNELMLAREAVAWEEKRILKELTDAIRDQVLDVKRASKSAIQADMRIAAARLSIDLNATVPELAKSGGFNLLGARHPLLLLDGVDVIPSNISCEPGHSIIISGPNAGGKTVVLKTVGLLGLMLAAGLPVPVLPGSSMGVPLQVLTDIGDEQSLTKNLSTFSAHIKNISGILKSASQGAVVLLDELSAGTDPNQGAALAEAFLEKLSNLNATTLATTHFESLKARAGETERFRNAAVGFDAETMQPTFDFRLGTPGSSSALAVAARFGAPEDVLARAREILPEGLRGLSAAVDALDKQRRDAAIEREGFIAAREKAERKQRELDGELAQLRRKQDKLVDKEMNELWLAIRRGREKVRDAEVSIRRRRSDEKVVSKARRVINNVAEELDPRTNPKLVKDEALPGRPAEPSDIIAGALVHVNPFGARGTVEADLKGNRALVRIGNVKTKVKLSELRALSAPKPTEKPRKILGSSNSSTRVQALKTSENTVDLRGARVDEAVDATDRFLDKALQNEWATVFILHGHGTGALKDAIRDYLSESSYVDDFRPGERDEGGDGVTVVWIR